MAMTNAEKVRRYRERQKQKETQESLTVTGVFQAPFFKFVGEDGPGELSEVEQNLAHIGFECPVFDDDRGPECFNLDGTFDPSDRDNYPFRDVHGSLGRAELMVGMLTEAARSLAYQISAYKRSEIKARLAEIEASDLSEPEAKKAALKEAARLNKMLDQLDKQVRWTFPQWKVTG
ncbi:hypothetical protein [Szabonella alba]|uniref:Uncharacterized protein n=1 Tax=Szabonella alba TaxID=2804194 RepID=A0A8K0V971_9RHOB|nr:hypothetical protein [Szabonella alba]MBL4917441.1 hypothetical protein [Szabonella alba]